jgi:hypothetical protein
MRISPLLSSPSNTTTPKYRQGGNFQSEQMFETYLNVMSRYFEEQGATETPIAEVFFRLKRLKKENPQLPVELFTSLPQDPTKIRIELDSPYQDKLMYSILPDIIDKAYKAVGYTKKQFGYQDNIHLGIAESGQITIHAELFHNNAEEAARVVHALIKILDCSKLLKP